MPNTIAHFAINGLVTKGIFRDSDIKWILLACVIPDLPWIIQRIIRGFIPGMDLYDLRAYCIIQSSLIFCLLISAFFSFLAKNERLVFITLAFGSILHLFVDAMQFKWANGVHFFVPINWDLTRYDLFWPESIATYLLTIAGLLYVLFYFKQATDPAVPVFKLSLNKGLLALVFLCIWFVAPFTLIDKVYLNDNHYINTLKQIEHRQGKYIELDRNQLIVKNNKNFLRTPFGEEFEVSNIKLRNNGKISVQGRFLTPKLIHIERFHIHSNFRDYASLVGLTIILLIWSTYLVRFKYNR